MSPMPSIPFYVRLAAANLCAAGDAGPLSATRIPPETEIPLMNLWEPLGPLWTKVYLGLLLFNGLVATT